MTEDDSIDAVDPVAYPEVGEGAMSINPGPPGPSVPVPTPYTEVGERALSINTVADDPLMPATSSKYELRTAIEDHGVTGDARISSSRDVYFRILLPYWTVDPGTYVAICMNAKNLPVFVSPIYGTPRDVLAVTLLSGAAGMVVGYRVSVPSTLKGATEALSPYERSLRPSRAPEDIATKWMNESNEAARLLQEVTKKLQIRLLDFVAFVSESEWGARPGYGYLSYLDMGLLPPEG